MHFSLTELCVCWVCVQMLYIFMWDVTEQRSKSPYLKQHNGKFKVLLMRCMFPLNNSVCWIDNHINVPYTYDTFFAVRISLVYIVFPNDAFFSSWGAQELQHLAWKMIPVKTLVSGWLSGVWLSLIQISLKTVIPRSCSAKLFHACSPILSELILMKVNLTT